MKERGFCKGYQTLRTCHIAHKRESGPSTAESEFKTEATTCMMKVCIVGISGKLGQYMVKHCLDKGYEVVGVCREKSVSKLDKWKEQITVFPGPTNDRDVIKKAVEGCNAVLVVLVPWGIVDYSSGTAQAVMDHSPPGARLIFSCGWHITRDGQDVYSKGFLFLVSAFGWVARKTRIADLNDQVKACQLIFDSDTRWTVVRGSDLEEGESQGLPVWSEHVQDPILKSNMTRRIDFALFMVEAIENDALVHQVPAICGCKTPSALAHAAEFARGTDVTGGMNSAGATDEAREGAHR